MVPILNKIGTDCACIGVSRDGMSWSDGAMLLIVDLTDIFTGSRIMNSTSESSNTVISPQNATFRGS